MKCFVLNINIFSSPHDVMQIARNKLCMKENVCFFPKYPRYLSMRDTPPPVDRMTDRCKDITLPQLRCTQSCKLGTTKTGRHDSS